MEGSESGSDEGSDADPQHKLSQKKEKTNELLRCQLPFRRRPKLFKRSSGGPLLALLKKSSLFVFGFHLAKKEHHTQVTEI